MHKPLRFWGTGAAAAIPTPFCKCEVCEHARQVGGKEVRMRSAFRIDEKVMIDLGADYISQAVRLGEDLADVEHFLFTHSHDDHIDHRMFWTRASGAVKPLFPMNIYLTEEEFDYVEKFLFDTPLLLKKDSIGLKEENVIFKKLEYQKTYEINGLKITPLKGKHITTVSKYSANYLVRLKDGRYLYYGLDTGLYPEETLEYLKDYKLDILISECTYPTIRPFEKEKNDVHLDIAGCIYMMDRLFEQGTIADDTEIYLTHIAAKGMNHHQLEEFFTELDRSYQVRVAYDGLSLAE